jgi:APA family basic amino acid/polyamine antiporter
MVASALGWIGVFVVHGPALFVGGGWMLFGLVAYLVYRRYVEGTSLTKRVTVPELALKKQTGEPVFSSILVPVFGTGLDDDIVSTAGRIAESEVEEGELNAKLEVIFVPEMPLTVPLNAPLPPPVRELADRTLERATDIGDEYENVDVATAVVPARNVGAGIVEEARRSGAEVIVMGAEPPTKIRGGSVLGGIGASRPAEIGKVTEYVLRKAPCRVLLTAPPEERIEEEEYEDEHTATPE